MVRGPPYPIINPTPGWWESVDAMDETDYSFAIKATLAGVAVGVWAGRAFKHHALTPFNMGVTWGLTCATASVFRGGIHGYQRLKGFRDNGLPPVYPEFAKFPDAPRVAVETLHLMEKYKEE